MAIGTLNKVDLRSIWRKEASDFTIWLENNLNILSEKIGIELSCIEREKQVGSFSIDLLAETPDGDKVIIENQLEKTDHTHLGQIITYATNLEAKVIIWIVKEARPEHINAINWLNETTDLCFYLIQIEAYTIDNSRPAPLFNFICKPDDDMKAIGSERKEFTDRENFNVKFWESLMLKCKGRLDHYCNKKASKYHFHGGSSGKSGLTFNYLQTNSYYGFELYIDTGDKDKNKQIFDNLQKQKLEIESEFGSPLIWDRIEDARAARIRFHIQDIGITETDWNKAQDEMILKMEVFEKVIRPRIRALNLTTNPVNQ